MGKLVTREWRKAKSAELEFAFISAFRDNSSFGLNILGLLCIWQCLNFQKIPEKFLKNFTFSFSFHFHFSISISSHFYFIFVFTFHFSIV